MLLQNFDHECRHHYATCEIPVLRFVTSLVQNIEHGAVNSALSPSIMKEVTLLKKKLHFTSCNSIKKIHDPLLPNGIRCYCPPPSAWHYLFHCTKSIVNILWCEVRSKPSNIWPPSHPCDIWWHCHYPHPLKCPIWMTPNTFVTESSNYTEISLSVLPIPRWCWYYELLNELLDRVPKILYPEFSNVIKLEYASKEKVIENLCSLVKYLLHFFVSVCSSLINGEGWGGANAIWADGLGNGVGHLDGDVQGTVLRVALHSRQIALRDGPKRGWPGVNFTNILGLPFLYTCIGVLRSFSPLSFRLWNFLTKEYGCKSSL